MKRNNIFSFLFIFIAFLLSTAGCKSSVQRSEKNADLTSTSEAIYSDEPPKITFINNEHDFGEIVEGEMITHVFKFSNSGGNDLLISDVRTSCGCTASEFPKEPIKPGGTGVIKLTFDSRGQTGYQNKTATLETNTSSNQVFLRIKATVKKK